MPRSDGSATLCRPVQRQDGGASRADAAHDTLWPQRQRPDHDDESEDDAVGWHVDEPELLGQANQERTDCRSRNRPHTADDNR